MNVPIPVLAALVVAPLGPLFVAPPRSWRAFLLLSYCWPLALALRAVLRREEIRAIRAVLGEAVLGYNLEVANAIERAPDSADVRDDDRTAKERSA